VVLKRFLAQHLVFCARGQGYPQRKGGEAGFDCCAHHEAFTARFQPKTTSENMRFTSPETTKRNEHCSDIKGFLSNKGKMHPNP
jgi:hypothetical protein